MCDAEYNSTGSMFSINFTIPADAKEGDLYPIGIRYQNAANTIYGYAMDDREFVALEIIASGECGAYGDKLTWTLDSTGTLTISGEGEMADWNYGTVP